MITLLERIFIKQGKDERRAYGILCGTLGIALNLLLFAGKYLAGFLSGSIAVMADAFNNLSDAGSSVITLLGFQFAGQAADEEHPFGHGRIEYLSGLAVSIAIIVMGVELGRSSIEKIIHPEAVDTGVLSMAILLASVAVKLYMSFYNRRIGAKIDSAAMKATAMDSLSDALATSMVLISMLIMKFTGVNVDGWCGVLVAVFILKAGYEAAKETLNPLLGQAPEPEFIEEIHCPLQAGDYRNPRPGCPRLWPWPQDGFPSRGGGRQPGYFRVARRHRRGGDGAAGASGLPGGDTYGSGKLKGSGDEGEKGHG